MTGDRVTSGPEPDLTAPIRERVAEGECRTVSDVVNRAVLPMVETERVPVAGGPIRADPPGRFFDSGRHRLREAVLEAPGR